MQMTYYISHVILRNIRGFKSIKIDFQLSGLSTPSRGENFVPSHLFLGRNGTCKTTILRCIALGLAPQADANAFLAEPVGDLVGPESSSGYIEIGLKQMHQSGRPRLVKTNIRRQGGREIAQRNSRPEVIPDDFFLVGYGIGRRTEGPDTGRSYRIIDSAYSLFQYETPLIGVELAMRRLEDYLGTNRYKVAMNRIKEALGLTKSDQIETVKGGGVIVRGPSIGTSIPLEGWADGYRVTFMWLMDFLAWAMRADVIRKDGAVRGVFLIDEIEQHLHPALQSEVIPRFSNLFPAVQLIATTHSPTVALDVTGEEMTVLRRSGNHVEATKLPNTSAYSIQEMQEDPRLFGAPVYSSDLEALRAEYRGLTNKNVKLLSKKERSRLSSIATELRRVEVPDVLYPELARELKLIREKGE